jgi:tetratricopeptide (TPR) repeat protein
VKRLSCSDAIGKVLLSAPLAALIIVAACQSASFITEIDSAQNEAVSADDQRTAPSFAGSAPVRHSNAAAKQMLGKGISLYEQGKYAAAIKKLKNSHEIWLADDDLKIKAHKYLAFCYCVTKQRQRCRHEFEKILDLVPSFELEAAEAGHPFWGVEFKQAKKHGVARGQVKKEPGSKGRYTKRTD